MRDNVGFVAHLQYDLICERARAFNLVLPLQNVTSYLTGEWKVALSPEAQQLIQSLSPSKDEVTVLDQLMSATSDFQGRFALQSMTSLRGWGARLRFLWHNLLFPSAGFMQNRYQISTMFWLPLYYPYRWISGLLNALAPPDQGRDKFADFDHAEQEWQVVSAEDDPEVVIF